jgi:hypothetical protein
MNLSDNIIQPIAEHQRTLFKGFIGVASSGTGFLAEHATWLEPWIRFLALVVGLMVGIVTLVSIILDIRRKWHIWQLEKLKESLWNEKEQDDSEEEIST